jgi:hypothetical protein
VALGCFFRGAGNARVQHIVLSRVLCASAGLSVRAHVCRLAAALFLLSWDWMGPFAPGPLCDQDAV